MFDKSGKRTIKINGIFRLIDSFVMFFLNLFFNFFLLKFFNAEYAGIFAALTSVTMMFFALLIGYTNYYVQQLYKPIASNNNEKLSQIFWTAEKNFKTLGLIALLFSFIFMIVYTLLVDTNNIGYWKMIFYWLIYASSRIFSIAFNSKYWNFVYSHEKGYIMSMGKSTISIILFGVSFALLSTGYFAVALLAYWINGILLYVFCRFIFVRLNYWEIVGKGESYFSYVKFNSKKLFNRITKKADKDSSNIAKFDYVDNMIVNSTFSIIHSFFNNLFSIIPLLLIPIFVSFEKNSIFAYYSYFYTLIGTFILGVIINSLKPTLAKKSVDGKYETKLIDYLLNIFIFVGLLMSIIYVVSVPELINNIYGNEWDGNRQDLVSYWLSFFIALQVFFYFVKQFFILLINTLGWFKETTKNALIEIILFVLLIILVPMTLYFTNVDDMWILISFPAVTVATYFVRIILDARYTLCVRHNIPAIDLFKESMFFISSIAITFVSAWVIESTSVLNNITHFSSSVNILILIAVDFAIITGAFILWEFYKKNNKIKNTKHA
ncbi:MAG: hypothetical protein HRS57_01510 [Mycoplasmataceae bacterium]|nr:hypothetical protein [Mycoplasmataceae bacterium]